MTSIYKPLFLSFLLLITLSSCTKQSLLEKTIGCSQKVSEFETKTFTDVKEYYKIAIPKTWKTKRFYSESQSDIFTADTVKQLTETYILDTSLKIGEFDLSKDFEDKIIEKSPYPVITSQFENIISKPSFWYISKGNKNNFPYHKLELFIKISEMAYFQINIEVYGDSNINERFCSGLNIIKTIELLQ